MSVEDYRTAYVPCACHHPSGVDDPAFQSMLDTWNKIALVPAGAPIGTVADLDGEHLPMLVVGGQLHMAISPDYEPRSTDLNVHRPEDFDGIGEEEFAEIKARHERWPACEGYAGPTNGETLTKIAADNNTSN